MTKIKILKQMKTLYRLFITAFSLAAFVSITNAQADSFIALKTNSTVLLDGISDESIWGACEWYPLKYVWIPYGQTVSAEDFTGKFKVAWNENYIYFLVQVTDDSLYDGHSDPIVNYWDDDCVEVFLDEDHSGGNHLNNFNAFAYHISTLLDAVDNNTTGPALFNNDVDANYTKNGDIYTWELALKIFDDSYVYGAENTPIVLTHGKVLGFSMAYCDNDGSSARENFIGSKYLPQNQANDGYINADVFGTLNLVDTTIISSAKTISDNRVFVYPTIVKNRLTIKSTNINNDKITISIRNSSGTEFFHKSFIANTEFSVNTENFQPGSYILLANSADNQSVNFFIKQ
jgi:hypothetical protein